MIKSSNKVHSFGKRDQAIRRNPNVPVVVRGWLHKQVRRLGCESGGGGCVLLISFLNLEMGTDSE